MADKDVKIRVATEGDLSGVKPIEAEINKLKQQKLRLDIDANTQKLQETEHRIQSLKIFLDTVNTGNTNIHINDSDIKKAEEELAALEAEKIDVNLDVETAKLEEAKLKLDAIDDESINPQINTISAMEGIEQIGQGFDRLKQGASEVGQKMGEVLESAGRMEQTESFLSMNMGADQAKQKLQEIRSVTDQLPGDDVTLQNLLSQAALKDASMTTDAFNQMGSAAADYMAAMQNFGKTSTETQQDLMNYILAGNTAEIERSPILQSHVDKLKEGTTVQERAKLLQEALTAEGWNGISQQDTYNNKLQTFNDMIERGKMNLGGMFQEGAKWGMDLVMQLDSASGGLVGMGIALAGFATPLTDALMGLGQMATGIKAVKDAADFAGIAEKLSPVKTAIMDVGTVAKDAALKMVELGKQALLAGLNALKSVAMWTAQKLAVVASTLAEWGLAAAQAFLNLVMSMNPIMLIVIALVALAAALIWAYYNVDWFRQMVDGAWQSLVQLGQQLYGIVAGAIQWVMGLFQQFTSQLGLNTQDWIQAIIGFILFIPQLPLRLGIALANAIARALGFKGNFVESLISAASNAVSGFVNYITQLPGIVMGEFNRVLGLVNDFINSLPDRVWDMGQAIIDALKRSLGIGSPGHMFYMLEGELERLEDLPSDMEDGITRNVRYLGEGIVDSFNPNLNSGTLNGDIANGGYGGQVNFYFSDITVDNDERMEKIYDYITRRLNFDNKTAGRSV